MIESVKITQLQNFGHQEFDDMFAAIRQYAAQNFQFSYDIRVILEADKNKDPAFRIHCRDIDNLMALPWDSKTKQLIKHLQTILQDNFALSQKIESGEISGVHQLPDNIYSNTIMNQLLEKANNIASAQIILSDQKFKGVKANKITLAIVLNKCKSVEERKSVMKWEQFKGVGANEIY